MDGSFNKEVKVKLDPSAIKKSIAHAQEMGTWPKKAEPSNKEVTPPFVETASKKPPIRTPEKTMEVFHKIEDEYRRIERGRKANIQTPNRTDADAMIAFHKIEDEYRRIEEERKAKIQIPQTQEQVVVAPQIEQTPSPVITEKKNIFKRLFARILGKS